MVSGVLVDEWQGISTVLSNAFTNTCGVIDSYFKVLKVNGSLLCKMLLTEDYIHLCFSSPYLHTYFLT